MFCPKCGSQVPANASFCGKCGHQFAARNVAPATPMNVRPALGGVGGFSPVTAGSSTATMSIARAVMAVIMFILLFLPWLELRIYGLGSGGASFFELCELGEIGFLPFVMVLSEILVLAGAVVGLLAKMEWGRWVCLVGALIILGIMLWVIISGLASGDFGRSEYGSYGFSFAPWVVLVLSVLTVVSCFIKR
ncbi:MAG: zinc ribbon domain-containing protein [Eggerthellaceae bacterium]|nr:zinc ribbon domain-containing protein [Eggerthellaceae bacterium]